MAAILDFEVANIFSLKIWTQREFVYKIWCLHHHLINCDTKMDYSALLMQSINTKSNNPSEICAAIKMKGNSQSIG